MISRTTRLRIPVPRFTKCVYCRRTYSDTHKPEPDETTPKSKAPPPSEVRRILATMFDLNHNAPEVMRGIHRQMEYEQLRQDSLDEASARVPSQYYDDGAATKEDNTSAEFLARYPSATSVLYWYSPGLSFEKTDFERLLPPPVSRVGRYPSWLDKIDFDVVRSRDPDNLTPWMGYYLKFADRESAAVYYQESMGAELCGLQGRFRFVNPGEAIGLSSPVLNKMPNFPRKQCALLLGLPDDYPRNRLLRVLWDYDLLSDDNLAYERLPKKKVRYGGSPILLRFNSPHEATRLVREFDHRQFPHTTNTVFVQVVD